MRHISYAILAIASLMIFSVATFAQQNGSLSGTVQDTLGAVVVGATVTVVDPAGKEKTTTSNGRGEFAVSGLAPGTYTVKVKADKFSLYENADVQIAAGKKEELMVPLSVEAVTEQVEVSENQSVSNDPQNNAGATVLKDKDLDALPDDPDELESALQALAGASAGPNGGQIYIDGFTGGQLPPKESIREVRINNNPFSAEYDRLGFGRIEILTKPGSDKYRGSANFNFNDESLNSRNPFAINRAPSQTRSFGGNFSGPLQKGKSSFFIDVNNRDVDNNSVLNAIILDQDLNPTPFQQDLRIPSRRFSINPRFDYAINDKNTLVARYSFGRSTSQNNGIGGTSLPNRAYDSENTDHEIRLTETMIINPTTVNETRFEYEFEKSGQNGDNSIPTIGVAEAFTGGGSQIGNSFDKQRGIELQNYTTTSLGKSAEHSVKFGIRIRSDSTTDHSESNFAGNFSFTNLTNYRDTILGLAYPTQMSITTGDPDAKVSQTDVGLFITDDWRISPAFTFSMGLRYENQNNIKDNGNFAPRLSFAWAPGANGQNNPKTVIRGGVGWFYDRFSDNLTMTALRYGGNGLLNLVVNSFDPDPVRQAAAIALLQQPVFTVDGVTNVPTAADILAALPQSNTLRTISPNIQAPYMMQTSIGVERQLPMQTRLGFFYVASRTLHVLRARNINAPICPLQENCEDALRPDPTKGNVYEYESTGIQNQNQLIVNFSSRFSQRLSFFGNYRLGFAKGDSDGAGTFPAYTYDLSDEYGRASFDIRHNFVIGGSVTLPYRISLSPFINMNSGRPFNITRGVDLNGDALYNERPTFGELGARCSQLGITASYCDVAGQDANSIIPRNWGQSSKFFSVNLRLSKTFGFGSSPKPAAGGGNQRGGMRGVVGGGGGMRGGFGRGGFFGGSDERKPYNLTLSLNVNNLFNNVNFSSPVGNMASSRFGLPTSTSGGFGGFGRGGGGSANRKIDLQARFSW